MNNVSTNNPNIQVSITVDGLTRRFGRRTVFEGVSAHATSGQVLAITGANGSGKSTFLRIVAGLLAPNSGRIEAQLNGVPLDMYARKRAIGYVAPDLTLYSELTAVENLQFFAGLRGITLTRDDLKGLLERVGLLGRGRDEVGAYSSGMRQRLKYAFALLHHPPILLLDEPTANLDEQGIAMVETVVAEHRLEGVTIIATNETREVEWGDDVIRFGA